MGVEYWLNDSDRGKVKYTEHNPSQYPIYYIWFGLGLNLTCTVTADNSPPKPWHGQGVQKVRRLKVQQHTNKTAT